MKKADTVLDLMARAFGMNLEEDADRLKAYCELYNLAKAIDVLDDCTVATLFGGKSEPINEAPVLPDTQPRSEPLEDPAPPAAPAVPQEQSFSGRGSAEKQAIFIRLQEYVERSGSGWAARLCEASKGSLSTSTIRDMLNCGKHPLAEWIMLRRALDAVEGTEAGA